MTRDAPTCLFAYGTLAPDGPEAAARGGWIADRVRGRLYDLGPYPALVDCDDPGAGWVEGYVRSIDTGELLRRLDAYEGVEEGLYRRVAVTTRGRSRGLGLRLREAAAADRPGAPGCAGTARELPIDSERLTGRFARSRRGSHTPQPQEANDGHLCRTGPDS